MFRRVGFIFANIVVSTVAVGLCGLAIQAVMHSRELRKLEPQGSFVRVGGTAVHFDCRGLGAPTIVLESGATGISAMWVLVRASLQQSFRVCTYERPGVGWSEPDDAGCSPGKAAKNLDDLLAISGEKGPFIMVGHSLGSLYSLRYAGEFPGRVLGLVLLDPIRPDMIARVPGAKATFDALVWRLNVARALAWFGVLHALGPTILPPNDLPDRERREAIMFANSPTHIGTSRCELVHWRQLVDQKQGVASVTDVPLLVISAGRWSWDEANAEIAQRACWKVQEEIAESSPSGRWVVLRNADHLSMLLKAANAATIGSFIVGFAEQFRDDARLRTPMAGVASQNLGRPELIR
jgi:pimeloyl-ACP methyl ester carboxylesterase